MKKINAQVTEKGWLNFSYLKKVNTLVTSQFVAEKEEHNQSKRLLKSRICKR